MRGIIHLEIVHRVSRPACEIQGTGPRAGLLPARHGEKDQTATKRVESFRVPCLDAGSTPATSTPERRALPPFPGEEFFYGLSPGLRLFPVHPMYQQGSAFYGLSPSLRLRRPLPSSDSVSSPRPPFRRPKCPFRCKEPLRHAAEYGKNPIFVGRIP